MDVGESAGALVERPGERKLDGASNVLVLAPTLSDDARESYYNTLFPDDTSAVDLLAVDYRRPPDQYLDELRRFAGGPPDRCGIICVGETTRSSGDGGMSPGAVACVDDPMDLTGVGLKMGRYLETHGRAETVVSFDSVTVLLQYVDTRRAFRFLHAIGNRVRAVDATAHYHVDPNAHEDRMLATLSSLFDAVARFDDGEWNVRRR